jgi:hypothetical protein
MFKDKALKTVMFFSQGNSVRYLQVFILLAMLISSLLFPGAALADPAGGGVGN